MVVKTPLLRWPIQMMRIRCTSIFFLPKINEGYDLHFIFKDKGLTFINKDRE